MKVDIRQSGLSFKKTSPRRLNELAELGLESAELAKPGFCTSKDLHGQISPRADMCHLEHLGKQPSGNKAFWNVW